MKIKPMTLVNIILGTVLLTSMFFIGLKFSFTQPSELTEYDAWHDVNDDGKIDLQDIYFVVLRYATEGNPTKSVNVTNWPDWMVTGSGGVCNPVANNHLTVIYRQTFDPVSYHNSSIWGDTEQITGIGGKNITFVGGILSGGVTWSSAETSLYNWFETGGMPGVGRVDVYNSTDYLIAQFALPLTTQLTVNNVDRIEITAEVFKPYTQLSSSIAAYVVATIYWNENP